DDVAWKNGDRIAFLGDSITQAGARGNGYVNRIEAAVNQSSQGKAVEFVKAGISGHKVPDLLARVDRDVLSKKPTITFVYIGINDVWHFAMKNRQGTSLDAFEAGLDELVVRLKAGGSDVVLATPSVIGEKRAGENTQDGELDRYAAASRRIATKHGLVLCDLRRDFQDRLELLNHEDAARGILTSDGVHLNDAGNAFVAGRVAVALRTALARR
ncbi:MAG: SGNH/GDSL hydrolase family protein, partial [Phycisphaerales bacterium]|nr:SGNH/GDSL hydrolase family protein [Phycisphaerales bacterium]